MIMNENLGRAMLQRRNDEREGEEAEPILKTTTHILAWRGEEKQSEGRVDPFSFRRQSARVFHGSLCQLRKERSRSSNFSQALNSAKHNTIAGLAGVLPLPHKIEPARLCAAVVVFVLSA